MARTIAVIKQQMIDAKNAQSDLSGLSSTSTTALWNLIFYVVAVAISLFENVLDIYTAALEAIAFKNSPATAAWLQDQVFKFQYDATTPQILQLDISGTPPTFQSYYPIVDATKRIVTRCSVKTDANKIVNVKVAKNDPPEALSGGELSALQSFLNIKEPAGIAAKAKSSPSDKLFVEAEVYYNGQYSAVISDNVIAAMDAFLAGLDFDGIIRVSDLEGAIKSVAGVSDVVFKNVIARADATDYPGGTKLVDTFALSVKQWQTIAGYIIQEDSSGGTFVDKLTFTAE